MKNFLCLIAIPTLCLAGCQPGEEPANDTVAATESAAVDLAAEEQAIRGQVARWLQLIKDKDAASIAAMYTAEGAIMPPNAPIAKGHGAIEAAWAGMMQAPGFELTFAPDVIELSSSGDMALDRGTYSMTVAPDGTAQTDTGKYVVVWRKVDGEWKAAADIINSDLPVSTGE